MYSRKNISLSCFLYGLASVGNTILGGNILESLKKISNKQFDLKTEICHSIVDTYSGYSGYLFAHIQLLARE